MQKNILVRQPINETFNNHQQLESMPVNQFIDLWI